jgi:flagellar hook-associated protein 1 FlgK
MASTFGGINTALTSLYAQRRGLDVTGQNIANASTEGYTRQRVQMQAQTGSLNPGVYSTTDAVGGGVTVSAVERNRNAYLDERGRTEHANSAYLSTQKAAYNAIEDVFAEPSDTALQSRLHDMWDGWNDVANNWQDPATRTTLIERSTTVATTLNDAHTSLSNQFGSVQQAMGTYVDQVNTLAGSIAEMNQQIVIAQQAGLEANELQDQRDRQVMQLSELAGASTSRQPNGAVNVYIGNAPLVSEFTTRKLEITGSTTLDGVLGDASAVPPKAPVPVALRWQDTGTAATAGGTMGSMLDTMNSILPDIVTKLNGVASSLMTAVNNVQTTSYTAAKALGQPFFSGTSAADIHVAIKTADEVAFSRGNPNGDPLAIPPVAPAIDNAAADELADIGNSGNGPDQVYQAMVGQLGVASQAAGRRSEIQDSVTSQVDTSRAAESGVNLDEEMTSLLTYQRGYEAASRVLTTIDSMLDQLINRTGLVGR